MEDVGVGGREASVRLIASAHVATALGIWGRTMRKEIALLRYRLYQVVTNLWSQLPMPLCKEYEVP